jgi:hypothetical protein
MDTEEGLRASLHEAFAMARAHPALRARVIGGVAGAARAGRGRAWVALGGLAATLALLVIAATVLAAHQHPSAGVGEPRLLPAGTPPGSPGGALQVAAQVGFSCALPVLVNGRAATLSLPGGAVTSYPGASTVGRGPGGAAFAGGRWLAPGAAAVSPDGRSYAYTVDRTGAPGASETSQVVVRDGATGREREVWHGAGYVQLAGWTGAGLVIVLQPRGDGSGVTEVSLLDPAHPGGARRIGPNPPYDPNTPHPGQLPLFTGTALIGDGALWTVYDDRPLSPTSGVNGPDKVARMDLRTGQVTTWYAAQAGYLVDAIGLDAQGLPVLRVTPEHDERIRTTPPPTPPMTLAVLTGRDHAQTVAGPDASTYWTAAAGDAHGTWITSQDALWLYRGGALERVGTMPPGAIDAVGYGLRVVGGCQ